ncbi:uncharacterized PE-PGRS family protein PE_PGRS46-like [Oenanthe melanoleuca]|uniref:uncharacterized PE-PGRS family protein PE_PGRS46-like n=1 Tax=Oenanthe melanoleuca TaxID=2939378 RepID=UPI0024C1D9D0|nr:uncharacterized PE-PGRS family protein PE_PGRS46-like [Oenanthe melanoleuca]
MAKFPCLDRPKGCQWGERGSAQGPGHAPSQGCPVPVPPVLPHSRLRPALAVLAVALLGGHQCLGLGRHRLPSAPPGLSPARAPPLGSAAAGPEPPLSRCKERTPGAARPGAAEGRSGAVPGPGPSADSRVSPAGKAQQGLKERNRLGSLLGRGGCGSVWAVTRLSDSARGVAGPAAGAGGGGGGGEGGIVGVWRQGGELSPLLPLARSAHRIRAAGSHPALGQAGERVGPGGEAGACRAARNRVPSGWEPPGALQGERAWGERGMQSVLDGVKGPRALARPKPN